MARISAGFKEKYDILLRDMVPDGERLTRRDVGFMNPTRKLG
jgi:hypothetical protein